MLRLKEQPLEWIKFTAVIGVALNAVLWLLWWRGALPVALPTAAAVIAVAAVVTASLRPAWFRGFYRGGMTFSYHIGQVFGTVLLTLFFFLILTPMGLVLRLAGKDLLHIRPQSARDSWWHPARNSRDFDRMF